MNADGALGDAVVLLQGLCVHTVSSVCSSQAMVKGSISLAKVPTSINRGAKEVCLLGPPWLDLRSSGKGCMITYVSVQPRENRASLVVLAPSRFLLINHRNERANHESGTNAKAKETAMEVWRYNGPIHTCSQTWCQSPIIEYIQKKSNVSIALSEGEG